MKALLFMSAFVTLSLTASIPEDAQAAIVQYDNTNDGKGNYDFSFLTSNGIERRETGKLVNVGQPNEHIEVEGVVSYKGADGNLVVIHYTAGEKGYHQVSVEPIPVSNRLAGVSPNVVASLLGK